MTEVVKLKKKRIVTKEELVAMKEMAKQQYLDSIEGKVVPNVVSKAKLYASAVHQYKLYLWRVKGMTSAKASDMIANAFFGKPMAVISATDLKGLKLKNLPDVAKNLTALGIPKPLMKDFGSIYARILKISLGLV